MLTLSDKREKFSGPVEENETVTLYGGVPPTVNTYDTQTLLQSYYYKHSVGENTPDYHKRKAKGELLPLTEWNQWEASGTATGDLTIRKLSDGFTHWYGPEGSYTYIPYWLVTTGMLEEIVADVVPNGAPDYDRYLTAAAAKIYSSGWDGLTFAAELGKTVRMFRQLAQRVVHQTVTGQLERQWLESRYGWRLLVYDIKDLIKLLNSLDDHRKRYRDSAGESFGETRNWSQQYTSELYNAEFDFVDEVEVGARGTIVADITPPRVALNPITTAWELIPFSFVADWFVNIGKYLESLSFLALSRKHFAAAGLYAKVRRKCVSDDVTWTHAAWTVDKHVFSSDATSELTKRTPSSVPYIPSTSVNLSAAKVADLGAIVGQTMFKRYRHLQTAIGVTTLALAMEEAKSKEK